METVQAKHILIVDDSEDNQFLLKLLLENKGYTTECSSNGEEALTKLRANKKKPQTILLDLQMPVMNGYDFRLVQKSDPKLCGIPVIVMSAERNTAEAQRKTDAEVLLKPFDIVTLLSAIKRTENALH